jgi:hypothetical protein
MKLALVLSILLLSGCSTYGTHVRTGCVWSCAEWQQKLAEGQTNYASGTGATSPGQTAHTYNLPNASYMVIRSGSTTSVIQTSKTR